MRGDLCTACGKPHSTPKEFKCPVCLAEHKKRWVTFWKLSQEAEANINKMQKNKNAGIL